MQKVDPLVLVVERSFDVPPEMIYDAWLNADSLRQWLFATPQGTRTQVHVNPRVGGELVVVEQRGEVLAEHFCTFLELERPRRIVFHFTTSRAEPPSRVSIDITPTAAGAHLRLTHEMDSKWADYLDRTRNGWTTILNNLAATLPRP